MNASILRKLSLFVALLSPLVIGLGCSDNTSHVVSHSETNKAGWFGGQIHEVNTVYKNDDGSSSVETETSTTKGDTTTITREKKTTNLDGTVKTDKESRTIVKGSDSTNRETKTTN